MNLIPTPENDIWTPGILQVIKEEAVKAVVYTGYSDGAIIPALFDELKAAGIVIIYRDINPTPANSRAAERAGADMIVATGFDEGGTLPGTALGAEGILPPSAAEVRRISAVSRPGVSVSTSAASEKARRESATDIFDLRKQGYYCRFYFLATFLARRECRASGVSGKLEIDLFALDLHRVNRLPSVNGLHIALPVLIQKRP